jgi:predicted nuclease of predicted toxin-antitoxin system
MRLLADECCETKLIEALRAAGHDVLYVLETFPGATDDEVLSRAVEEGRILLTEDKDFGELVYRMKLPSSGVVLLRFGIGERDRKIARTLDLFTELQGQLPGKLTVIDGEKIRFRPLMP